MRPHIALFHIDAFATKPFAGNPAAVVLLARTPDEHWMQSIAAEMNLSETAFIVPEADQFLLRWFTPKAEVDLCGHATLASAHALWESRATDSEVISFSTRSGTLRASRVDDGIELDFPAEPAKPAEMPPALAQALGGECRYVGRNRFDHLVEMDSQRELVDLHPNMALLAKVPGRAVIVTTKADDPRFDFASRFFAPAVGVDEDPVTGSAHCCLGPFWGERLGKNRMLAYQASPRGGEVGVKLNGDRVGLVGRAVTIARGQILC